jgi:hypothetical protein
MIGDNTGGSCLQKMHDQTIKLLSEQRRFSLALRTAIGLDLGLTRKRQRPSVGSGDENRIGVLHGVSAL